MEEIIKTYQTDFPIETQALRQIASDIENHDVFRKLNNIHNIRIYSEYQIWSVWDFMSILKCVQNFIFTNDILWLPPINPYVAHLLYSILDTEETDKGDDKGETFASHFQSFIAAMKQINADLGPIDRFLTSIKEEKNFEKAVEAAPIPKGPKEFLQINHAIIKESPLNALALITLTREHFLPSVFTSLLKYLDPKDEDDVSLFIWYHKRHIELDRDTHAPMSLKIFKEYFTNNAWIKKGLSVSIESLNARWRALNEVNKLLS
jgi:hypothetical protein